MNILQTALCNLKDEIMGSGFFNRFYEYAELIERGSSEKFPQVYTGKGQYDRIYDFDVNGSGYIRKNGSVATYLVGSSVQMQSCSDSNPLLDIHFPLRLVAAVPKSKLSDNSFSDDTLAFDLMGYIGKRLPAVTGAQSVTGYVNGYITDRDIVWSQEVRGIEKQIDLNLAFIAIDFTITVRATLDCIKQNCDY